MCEMYIVVLHKINELDIWKLSVQINILLSCTVGCFMFDLKKPFKSLSVLAGVFHFNYFVLFLTFVANFFSLVIFGV